MLHLVTKSKKFHTVWLSRHLSPNTGSSDTKWLPTLTFPWNSTASPCKALAEFVPTSLALSNKVTQNFIPCRNVLGTFAVQGPSEVQELWWALNSDHSDLVWGTRFLTWLEGGGLWNWPQNSGEFGSGWVDPCHWCSHHGWGDEEPMGTSQLTLCHGDPPKIQWFPQNCCPPNPCPLYPGRQIQIYFFPKIDERSPSWGFWRSLSPAAGQRKNNFKELKETHLELGEMRFLKIQANKGVFLKKKKKKKKREK